MSDLITSMAKARFEPDEAKKKELFTAFIWQIFPQTLERFEKRLVSNSSQLYMVGDKLTTVDFQMITAFQSTSFNDKNPQSAIFQTAFETVPVLKAYVEYHLNNTFKEYIASRPLCEF